MANPKHSTALAFGIALAGMLLLPAAGTAQNTSSARRASAAQQDHQKGNNSQSGRRRLERRRDHADQGKQMPDDQNASPHSQQGQQSQSANNDGQNNDGQNNDGQNNDGIFNDGEFGNGQFGDGQLGNGEVGSGEGATQGATYHPLLRGVGLTNPQMRRLIAVRDRHQARLAAIRDSLAQDHSTQVEPATVASCWDNLPVAQRRALVGSDQLVRREHTAMFREVRQLLTPTQRRRFDANARLWATDRDVRVSRMRQNAHC